MVERKQLQLGYAATALHCYITHLFQQAMPLFMIISEDGFNVTKGRSFAGMMNWLNARMSANQGCNTAKGGLFAAPFFKYIMDGEVLLQYRERAEPFAAKTDLLANIKKCSMLQYRERAEPFAANGHLR